MVREPIDIRIFGRAVGLRHIDNIDDATPADIKRRPWRSRWPHYVRVHHAEFVAGTLRDGVSLDELMSELGSDAFAPTQRNARKGRGNTDPRTAYRQQAAIELTAEGFAWVNTKLEQAFATKGKMPARVLAGLDWPAQPKRPIGASI